MEERLANNDVPNILVKYIIGKFRQDASAQRRLFVRDGQRGAHAANVLNQQNDEPHANETQYQRHHKSHRVVGKHRRVGLIQDSLLLIFICWSHHSRS